jgi:hypothetical protein
VPHQGGFFENPTLTASPADAMLAYECRAPDDGSVMPATVWVTRDGAHSWQRLADVATGDALGSCTVVPDAADPAFAVAETTPYGFAPINPVGTFHLLATRDGGAHWAPLTAPPYTIGGVRPTTSGSYPVYDTVRGLATFRSATYALFAAHVESATPLYSALAVSTDGLRTWTRIDLPFGAMTENFWLNPATGVLLAQADLHGVTRAWAPLDTSTDGGADWSVLPGVPTDPAAYPFTYVVQQPIANQPWHVCAVYSGPYPTWQGTGPTPPPLLRCTSDGGRTWADRLGPELYAQVLGIANDGSVLKVSLDVPCRVYRLTPSANAWEALGQPPVAGPSIAGCWGVSYVAGSGRGAVWYLPIPNAYDPYLYPAPTAAQRLIYTAPYA